MQTNTPTLSTPLGDSQDSRVSEKMIEQYMRHFVLKARALESLLNSRIDSEAEARAAFVMGGAK